MKKRTVFALFFFLLALFFLFYEFIGVDSKDKEYIKTEGVIFGTTYHITYHNPEGNDLSSHITNAFNAVDGSLSMFNPNSTISKINSNQPVKIDSLFLNVWDKAQYISSVTHGAFDMTVAPLVDLWGFGLKNKSKVTDQQVDSALKYVSWEFMVLEGDKIHKAYPQMRLDAGAIAKGYACDVVADSLFAYGCTDYCVEIGGEIVVRGFNPKGDLWKVGINKPVSDSLCINNEIQEILELTDCGMATSGNYRNYYELDGRKFSHTIDPRSGYPVEHNLLSATIVAPDCITADAWATACMVAGFDFAKTWISNRADIRGYLIYEQDGLIKIWHSPDL